MLQEGFDRRADAAELRDDGLASREQHFAIHLPRNDDFHFWRDSARILVQLGVAPDRVSWIEPGGSGDLFASAGSTLPQPPKNPAQNPAPVRAPKRFLSLARNAALHSDPERFALLYRLLWRLQTRPGIMQDKADHDVCRVQELDKNVRRDSHKMHAFVRFRCVGPEGEGEEGAEDSHYVAWFEPEHHILRANASFFMRRFANMRWSILTPQGSLYWDGKTMHEGPAAQRSDAPSDDPTEDLWRAYYASIFNPARLKVSAMLSEMPKKYWKNMPEAELIPQLIAGAQSREATMVTAGAEKRAERPRSLLEVKEQVRNCRACAIADCNTRAVMGEGPKSKGPEGGPEEGAHHASLMIVGEQPGDKEELAGRPFVGPAGQLLDAHLSVAGIDREGAYVTNAVKHFKHRIEPTPRGKRRIHQTPTAKEIDHCRWWLDAERTLVQPRLVLALGASAARAILGKTVNVTALRGQALPLDIGAVAEGDTAGPRELWASELWVTAHPSYMLRLEGAARLEQERLFAADLAAVKARLEELQTDLASSQYRVPSVAAQAEPG
jgi:DNA polymerase